jgi:hypothetical protein
MPLINNINFYLYTVILNFRSNSINMTINSSIWFQFWKNLQQIILSPTENLTMEEFHTINTTTCLAHKLEITFIDKNYQFLPKLNIDKLLNKLMIYLVNHNDHFNVEILISTCGSLVCLKEFLLFPINDVQTLIAILSLPWMDISNNMFNNLPLYKYLNIILKNNSTVFSK